jgi:hypothetical protein
MKTKHIATSLEAGSSELSADAPPRRRTLGALIVASLRMGAVPGLGIAGILSIFTVPAIVQGRLPGVSPTWAAIVIGTWSATAWLISAWLFGLAMLLFRFRDALDKGPSRLSSGASKRSRGDAELPDSSRYSKHLDDSDATCDPD